MGLFKNKMLGFLAENWQINFSNKLKTLDTAQFKRQIFVLGWSADPATRQKVTSLRYRAIWAFSLQHSLGCKFVVIRYFLLLRYQTRKIVRFPVYSWSAISISVNTDSNIGCAKQVLMVMS